MGNFSNVLQWWVVKQVVVHSCYGILSSIWKEQTIDRRDNLDELKEIMLSEISQL